MIYSVDGTWVQIGITSFGDTLCELMKPKGFTRVQSYLGWISSITGVSFATTQRPTTPFSCHSDGNKANPYDCNTFYMCSNGTPYLFVNLN
jgi:secreted trypsin-like serine protease